MNEGLHASLERCIQLTSCRHNNFSKCKSKHVFLIFDFVFLLLGLKYEAYLMWDLRTSSMPASTILSQSWCLAYPQPFDSLPFSENTILFLISLSSCTIFFLFKSVHDFWFNIALQHWRVSPPLPKAEIESLDAHGFTHVCALNRYLIYV